MLLLCDRPKLTQPWKNFGRYTSMPKCTAKTNHNDRHCHDYQHHTVWRKFHSTILGFVTHKTVLSGDWFVQKLFSDDEAVAAVVAFSWGGGMTGKRSEDPAKLDSSLNWVHIVVAHAHSVCHCTNNSGPRSLLYNHICTLFRVFLLHSSKLTPAIQSSDLTPVALSRRHKPHRYVLEQWEIRCK